MKKIPELALVLLITLVLMASSYYMLFPTVLVIVPTAVIMGVVFVFRRSLLALVYFGYPLLFGLWSAWVGSVEMEGYVQSVDFAISVAVGILGLGMIILGLWKTLPRVTGEVLDINSRSRNT